MRVHYISAEWLKKITEERGVPVYNVAQVEDSTAKSGVRHSQEIKSTATTTATTMAMTIK